MEKNITTINTVNQSVIDTKQEETKMENINTTATTYKKFCSHCGKLFESTSKRASICPECKAKSKAESVSKAYAKRKEIGQTTALILKEDHAVVKEYADKMGVPFYRAYGMLLSNKDIRITELEQEVKKLERKVARLESKLNSNTEVAIAAKASKKVKK